MSCAHFARFVLFLQLLFDFMSSYLLQTQFASGCMVSRVTGVGRLSIGKCSSYQDLGGGESQETMVNVDIRMESWREKMRRRRNASICYANNPNFTGAQEADIEISLRSWMRMPSKTFIIISLTSPTRLSQPTSARFGTTPLNSSAAIL